MTHLNRLGMLTAASILALSISGIGIVFAAGDPDPPSSRNPGPITQPTGPKGTKDSSAKPKKKKTSDQEFRDGYRAAYALVQAGDGVLLDRADHQLDASSREVLQPSDAGRVRPRHDHHQAVAREEPRFSREQRMIVRLFHPAPIGRSEHVCRRPLLELGGEHLGAGEVELNLDARVRPLEPRADLAEGVCQRSGREHAQCGPRRRRKRHAVRR